MTLKKPGDTLVTLSIDNASLEKTIDALEQMQDRVTMILHARIAAGLIWPWSAPKQTIGKKRDMKELDYDEPGRAEHHG